MRRVLTLARPEAGTLVLGTIFLVLGSSMGLIYPQGLRFILDDALARAHPELIDKIALALGAVFLVQSVAIALRYYLFTTAGERVVARLRENLFGSLVHQEIAFFDERRTGELVSRLVSDTTVLQNAVSANISMALRNGVTAIGALALLFYTSPRLTGLMLAIVPAVAFGAVAYGRRVRKLSKEVQDATASASEVAEEALSGIRTVRSFAAEGHEADRYGAAVQGAFQLARRRAGIAGTFMGGASFAAYVAAAAVLWYGGRLVASGQLTAGALTSFLIYTLLVAFSLGAVSELWADYMKAVGAAERVFALLDRVPTIAPSGGATLARVEGRIEFDRVNFAYPSRKDVPVLKGIDLTIEPGQVVAIVGPSGAGKSTMASLVGRLYDPDGGSIRVDGRDVRTLDSGWLRQQIGVVAQEPILFSTTIADNIRYGRFTASDAEVEAAARTANAHDFSAKFPQGYLTLVGERGVQLSGGQKQRVAIARAVLKDPRILILDEATSALDAESEHLVQEALDRLMRNRTTLIIAHRLSTVIRADRVLVLDGGHIVQSGSHGFLMTQEGPYRRLVERQFVAA
jgi:ABC transporter fused permease/ATP-binding protein